jgi:hypothetical protein
MHAGLNIKELKIETSVKRMYFSYLENKTNRFCFLNPMLNFLSDFS